MKGLELLEEYKRNTCPFCQYHLGNECTNQDECFIKTLEKELKALDIILKYITIGNPFGNVYYIYLNDESEMIMPEDFKILKEIL